jgi:hypothetical protein
MEFNFDRPWLPECFLPAISNYGGPHLKVSVYSPKEASSLSCPWLPCTANILTNDNETPNSHNLLDSYQALVTKKNMHGILSDEIHSSNILNSIFGELCIWMSLF